LIAQRPPAALVRYGAIPEVARFRLDIEPPARGARVVVETDRGLELGTFLEPVLPASQDGGAVGASGEGFRVVREATREDVETAVASREECERDFGPWCGRIVEWQLQLELIDLEWTLDRAMLVLYVLNERGPESTKLAIHAAAAGLGVVKVQPVDAGGLVSLGNPTGSGGCGSGSCSCGES
jgi:cell fate regulator YaaT (PSP1 superfamily)